MESQKNTELPEKKKIVRGPRSNQKLKIMYLMKILLEETDEFHDITLNEIVDKLKSYNVTAERKSLYDDIENLRCYLWSLSFWLMLFSRQDLLQRKNPMS